MIPGFEELDYYQLLDVSPGAETGEIQEGYQRMKEAFGKEALASYSLYTNEERAHILRLVEEAYHTLMDPGSREDYDRGRAERNREAENRRHAQETLPFEADDEEPREHASGDVDQDGGEVCHAYDDQETMRMMAEYAIERRNEEEGAGMNEQGINDPDAPASKDTEEGSGGYEVSASPDREFQVFASAAEKAMAEGDEKAAEDASMQGIEAEQVSRGKEKDVDREKEHLSKKPDPELTGPTGELFRQARLYKGLTLDRAWTVTKIRRPILQAIEDEDGENLPAPVFLKGMLITYARFLEIEEPEDVAKGYLETIAGQEEGED